MAKPSYRQHTYRSIPVIDSRGPGHEVTSIKVSLTYSDGNMGGAKGFSLHAQPMEDDGTFEAYNPREGVRMFVHPITRFSRKQADLAITKGKEHVDRLVAHCQSHNPHLEVM